MTEPNDKWKDYRQKVLDSITDFSAVYSCVRGQHHDGNEKGWISGFCPLHNDQKTKSFGYNKKTGRFHCFVSCGSGSVFDFIAITEACDFKNALFKLGDQYGIPRPVAERPPILEEVVKKYQAALTDELRVYLRKERGLSDKIIDAYEIGYDQEKERYTIPIRDENGTLVNVRLYSPVKDSPVGKMLNYTTGFKGKFKYGTPARLYGLNELVRSDRKTVIIAEGEWDRLVLQQNDYLAVTGTHGSGTFLQEWTKCFDGKDVVIVYDCDEAGVKASNDIVLRVFKNSKVNSIRNVKLPLRGTPDDKDITDYFIKRNQTRADFQALIERTPVHSYVEVVPQEEVIPLESFTQIEKNELIDKKVQCEITVCGETSESYHAVEEFEVEYCTQMRAGKCHDCQDPIHIEHGSREYMGSCMSNDSQVISMLRSYCCKYNQRATIKITKRRTIKEFFVHQKVNRITQARDEKGQIIQVIDGQKQELLEKRAYYLSPEHVPQGNFLATGWIKTHPKTQQVTFLIESLVPREDDFQGFRVADNLDRLRAFQKLDIPEILDDLRQSVTKIYNRDEILLAVLLTYCSPLWINFNHEVIRGWMITAVIGDAGSGKTQTYQRVSEFINIGDIFSGLTGSRTGLSYALVEHSQKGWQVRIGRYPANSRKILIVDEAQFLEDMDLRGISKAIEEGFLQIDRVKSKGYESMTRLILVANPKGDAVMDSFTYGCEAVKSLYAPTIIRRIDLVIMANSSSIQEFSFINMPDAGGSPKVTSDMLRAVIYWIWSLRPDQVTFKPDAEVKVLEEATKLSNRFGHSVDVPLIIPSDARKTVARLSAAFAGLSLSSDEDFTKLIIKKEHVGLAVDMLEQVYSDDACGLDGYSEVARQGTQLLDYEFIEKDFLKKYGDQIHGDKKIFSSMIKIFRSAEHVRRDEVAEQIGCKIERISKEIALLKRYNLIESGRKGYKKRPKFNRFMRRFFREHPDLIEENANDTEALEGAEEPENRNRGLFDD